MQISELINKAGGNTPFSKALGIPLSTVEGWKGGKHCPQYNVEAYEFRLRELGIIKENYERI